MPLIPVRRRGGMTEFPGLPGLSDFRSEMNRLFDGLLMWPAITPAAAEGGDGPAWLPAIDVAETDAAVQVRMELPGVAPKDVDVNVTAERLAISGEKKSATESKGNGWTHRESHYGRFSRTIPLPDAVDPAKVTARFENGILTVEMAKTQAGKPHKVAITAG